MDGKMILNGKLNNASIPIQNLMSGVYILKLKQDENENILKFIKD